MYESLDDAEERQERRGGHDQGARAQVTSGKHLDSLAWVIRDDLIEAGFDPYDISVGRGLTIPGWFRPAKDWDMLAFDGNDLLAAIELKSINSSFGNNFNNRAEEAIGSAVDAGYAIKYDLMRYKANPPALGYVLVVKTCEDSASVCQDRRAVYPVDEAFNDASYRERFAVMCRRFLAERIYQAVWIVWVDPDRGEVIEPDPYMSYDRFIETIVSQLRINRA